MTSASQAVKWGREANALLLRTPLLTQRLHVLEGVAGRCLSCHGPRCAPSRGHLLAHEVLGPMLSPASSQWGISGEGGTLSTKILVSPPSQAPATLGAERQTQLLRSHHVTRAPSSTPGCGGRDGPQVSLNAFLTGSPRVAGSE